MLYHCFGISSSLRNTLNSFILASFWGQKSPGLKELLNHSHPWIGRKLVAVIFRVVKTYFKIAFKFDTFLGYPSFFTNISGVRSIFLASLIIYSALESP